MSSESTYPDSHPSESVDSEGGDDDLYEQNDDTFIPFQVDKNFAISSPIHVDSLHFPDSIHDSPHLDFDDGFGAGLDPFEFPPDNLFPHDPNFCTRLHDPDLASLSLQDLYDLYSEELALPVGARLKYFWPRWRALGCSSYTLHRMTKGITVEWIKGPPL